MSSIIILFRIDSPVEYEPYPENVNCDQKCPFYPRPSIHIEFYLEAEAAPMGYSIGYQNACRLSHTPNPI